MDPYVAVVYCVVRLPGKKLDRTPIKLVPVMIFYRYLSGIYHFFDSFGKCGKTSGIGMVLDF